MREMQLLKVMDLMEKTGIMLTSLWSLRHRMRKIKHCVGNLIQFSGSQNSNTLSPTEYHHNLKKNHAKKKVQKNEGI